MTDLDAATAYAKAWNYLDCTGFVDLLAPDAHYASQWVFEELSSRDAIADNLCSKMDTIRYSDERSRVYAEVVQAFGGGRNWDCVALFQGQKEKIDVIVTFNVKDGMIARLDLCAPEFFRVLRRGGYST